VSRAPAQEKVLRNRLSPRYVNIANTSYNCDISGEKQHKQAEQKNKRNRNKLVPKTLDQQK
jgi:hypothetical protein